MKNIKRTLAFLLCAVMILGLLPMISFAADGAPNISMEVSATEVNVGDTVTVAVNYDAMTVSSFAARLLFDQEILECTSIVGCDPDYPEDICLCTRRGIALATAASTVEEANGNGNVGFAYANTKDATYIACTIFTVTFTAKKAGTVTFTLKEDSAGTDGFKGDVETTTVTVVDPNASTETTIVFPCGEDGEAKHSDGGNAQSSYEQTVGNYTLTLTGANMYPGGSDAKGNGCVKLGTSKKAGSFSFTVPNDVTSVIIDVAAYKANNATVTINGTDYVLNGKSNNGEYDQITIDTSTNKTVSFTVKSGYRAMLNTVTYVIEGGSGETPDVPEHVCSAETLTKVDAKAATCQASGLLEHYVCTCGKLYLDADATTETTLEAVTVAQGEHDYNNPADARKCVHCGIYKDGSTLTVDEVLAYGATLASGATTEYKYYVVGTITEVANTKYGNMNITDDDENSLLIYGLYKDGVRYDAMETKPVAGDIIKVYGPIMNYNGTTVEIVNAELIEHTTPECTHENAVFQAGTPSTCSVAGTVDHWYCPDCDRNFADEACTEVLTDISAELGEHDYNNPEDARRCVHCGYYKPGSTLTIEEAIAFAQVVGDSYTGEDKYYVTGVITEVYNTTYGNMYITDGTNTLTIYGTYNNDGTVRYDAMETKPGVGDTITVYGVLGTYSNKSQMKNGWIVAHTPAHVCGEGTLTETEQLDAQCGVAGHKAYWTCSCGKVYADATATTEIPNLAVWKAEGGDGYIAPLTHKDEDPKDHKCDRCGEPVSACVSTLTETEKQEADCGNAGHKAYWTCTLCGKHYSDANATDEITDLAAWLAEGGEGYIPATGEHNYIPGEYIWSEDYSTCTVTGTCGCGATATATASSTSNVTTVGTCQTAEVVTYTADFAETWAEDQSKDVTGEKNMDNHVGELAHEYVDYYEHKTYYTCCPDDYDMVEHDDYEDECSCGAIGVRVYFYGAYYGEPDPSIGNYIYGSTFFVLKDQDLRLKIYPGGNYPYVSYSICDYALDDPWSNQEYVLNATELVVSHTWYGAEDLFITVNAYSIQTIDLNGGSLTDEAKESWGEFYDAEKNVIYWPGTYGAEWNLSWYTEEFVREGCILTGFMDGNTFCALDTWIQSSPENRTLTLVWKCENEHANTGCTVDEDGTHTITCDSCGEVLETFKGHKYDAVNHKCVCGHVEEFTLTLIYLDADGNNAEMTIQVPFGTKLSELAEVLALPSEFTVQNTDKADAWDFFYTYDGVFTHSGWAAGTTGDMTGLSNEEFLSLTMPAGAYTLEVEYWFTGWEYWYNIGWKYSIDHTRQSGWTQIGEDWYYFAPNANSWKYNNVRVEGLTRVPYNTALGHKNNETSTTYIDATEAWYLFDENGKLQRITGIIDNKYYADGVQVWHPGFVTVENELYYFVGDKENGGNKLADGIVYVTRLNGVDGFKPGYIWFKNGQIDTTKTEITTIKDNLFYFENGVSLAGAGMVEIEEGKYIFVRSGGQLAVGDYWVTEAKANGYVEGGKLYNFGEDGYLTIDPDKNGIIDGVYYKEGVPYYAGLIKIGEDYYYVRSNGQIATGWYYVTKTNGIDFGTTKLYFGEDGKLQDIKNGIHEGEDGKLYYYVNNRITGAGLIKIGEDYYYVKTSTGEVVTGTYYITVTNGIEGFTKGQKCEFDENGKFVK